MLRSILLTLALITPPDPAAYEYLGLQIGQCQTGVVYIEYYNKPATNPQYAELIVYRGEGPGLSLILEFAPDSSEPPTATYILQPGHDPERLPSLEALKQRYPSPCDIIQSHA